MKIGKISLFTFLILFFGCKEEKPTFYPELTESSIPKEGVLPYFKGEIMDPYWSESGELPEDLRKFPNITLLSASNDAVNGNSLLGKYTFVIFFYAKCTGVCPLLTRNMINLLPKIENQSDLQIVSITVNPDEDSPAVIEKFKQQYKITQSNWIFLTGVKTIIYDLARTQFGADVLPVNGKDDLKDFVHTENVFLLDKQNYLRGIYRAKGTGDLDRLLVEFKTLRNN